MMFNPIDLSRVLILLKLDISALLGYTGAVFNNFRNIQRDDHFNDRFIDMDIDAPMAHDKGLQEKRLLIVT